MADGTLREYSAAYDDATRYVAQLQALLMNTYGNSAESFQEMSAEYQDGYLWACSDLASRIHETLRVLDKTVRAAS